MEPYLRTWCEVDLDAIRQNMINIREKAGEGTKVMAVIKADGYGHGAAAIGRYIYGEADYFGVATIEEAVELRQAGIDKPVLVLGYTSPALYGKNLHYDVEQTIYTMEAARKMSEEAVKLGKTARIHIALDTGMTRIGVSPDEEGLAFVEEVRKLPGITVKGLFSHLSCADMEDKTYTKEQFKRFDDFVRLLESRHISIPVKHICNSAGIMEFDDHRYDMVRAGIILYGLYPSEEVDKDALALEPAMSWKTHVVNIMEPEMNRGISYGATYVTDHPCRIATISIGYADGYPRSLSNKGWVLIRGKKAPIVGRVCMDQTMVDITEIPDVEMEDVVTLIGQDGSERISVEDMADLSGSFNYEFVCDVGQRVKRVYRSRREQERKEVL
ncbi:MAG: alanine racemase [Clostridiales bacterium]|uniref:Alanine racemase n=1 Tax=Candidatus Anaerobutyricum stercoripullorum TaxID=2838456 RepID=A0A9D2BD56_9FIRM|nr:alanine racemase [Clostridiales bacterium]HIX71816.1 alanine racemase [Candidatus Anaerobutyricum stercoripullorum]